MKLIDKLKANKQMTQLVILVILFVISGFSILYMRHNKDADATTKELAQQEVVEQKANTKLSFKDEKSLPKTYTPGEKITLIFNIENYEGKTVDYLYVVSINGKQAAAHSLTVKNKAQQTVEQAFELPTDQQALDIEVKLPTQSKSIKFSMTRKS